MDYIAHLPKNKRIKVPVYDLGDYAFTIKIFPREIYDMELHDTIRGDGIKKFHLELTDLYLGIGRMLGVKPK